ncbi:ALP1-like protein [Tanacetum coccineum]
MNLNVNDENEIVSDDDDETDLWYMRKAIEIYEMMQQEGQSSRTRNPIYDDSFLRKLNFSDIQSLYYAHNTVHGFLGMLRSIDCMHREWTKCPKSWHDQFGRAGANHDITVLNNSPLFDNALDDITHVAQFLVNGVQYEKGYYLVDAIYPHWATFVESCMVARDEKHRLFKRRQESARKYVERAFGVLQGHWRIIQQPTRCYHIKRIQRIMY